MASISLSAGVSPALKDADFHSEVALLRRRDAPVMVQQFVETFMSRLQQTGITGLAGQAGLVVG
jgi:D-alanine-D-alanine ligase-like ATP-grasp enzyme